jgi:ribosomal protein S12 methylthiotransferase accessory factor
VGEAAVAPERFALFSDRQYGTPAFSFVRFSADTKVAWVEGREAATGRAAFLPADLVFLGRIPAGGAVIGYATSSGLACAESTEAAVAHGLFELLERDAFMVVWSNRLALPLLDTAGTSLPDLFEASGLGFSAVDLSPFHGIPTVLGVVRAPRPFPGALGVGAAAAPTIEQAYGKALAEAFAVRSAGAKLALLHPNRRFGESGEGVESFDDHILFYADHDRVQAADFLDASRKQLPVAAVPPLTGDGPTEWIQHLCDRIADAGSSAYVVDVTSPDVAALGPRVMRVIAPELCRLDVSHAARFLGGRRLYEAAERVGLRSGLLPESDVNPDPHPFP